jgi:hypothetical protein
MKATWLLVCCFALFAVGGKAGRAAEAAQSPTVVREQAVALPRAASITFLSADGQVEETDKRVIVEKFDLPTHDLLYWKIQPDGYIESVRLGGRLPKVEFSTLDETKEVIAEWKKQGVSARITDDEGAIKEVSNLFLEFAAPYGYQFNQVVPDPRFKCLYLVDSANSQMQLPFSDIQRIRFEGDRLLVTLKSGEERSGVVRAAAGSQLRPYFGAVWWDGQGHPSRWGAARQDKGHGVDVWEPGEWPIKLIEFEPF